MSYVFPSLALVPLVLSKFLMEHITGQFRLLTLVGPCWMEAPWLLIVLGILEDILHQCPIIKPYLGCFGTPGAQRSAVAAFNPLSAYRYAFHRQGLTSLVCKPVVGESLC